MNVSTNVERYLLNVPHHKLPKTFRNNMKISYSCMPNMKSNINIHNETVTNQEPSSEAKSCNCINKSKCPLNNNCLSNNVLFKENAKSATEN